MEHFGGISSSKTELIGIAIFHFACLCCETVPVSLFLRMPRVLYRGTHFMMNYAAPPNEKLHFCLPDPVGDARCLLLPDAPDAPAFIAEELLTHIMKPTCAVLTLPTQWQSLLVKLRVALKHEACACGLCMGKA